MPANWDWAPWVAGMIGTGAVGAMLRDIANKVVPNRETAAEREDKRIAARESNLDANQKLFQDSIRRELDQVRELHNQCERDRKEDNDKCQAALLAASEKIANLNGRVEFFQSTLHNLKPGAPSHARRREAKNNKTR